MMHTLADLACGHEGKFLGAIADIANRRDGTTQASETLTLLDSIQTSLDLLTTEYAFKILAGAAVAQARLAVECKDEIALQDIFCALRLGAQEQAKVAYSDERDAGEIAH